MLAQYDCQHYANLSKRGHRVNQVSACSSDPRTYPQPDDHVWAVPPSGLSVFVRLSLTGFSGNVVRSTQCRSQVPACERDWRLIRHEKSPRPIQILETQRHRVFQCLSSPECETCPRPFGFRARLLSNQHPKGFHCVGDAEGKSGCFGPWSGDWFEY